MEQQHRDRENTEDKVLLTEEVQNSTDCLDEQTHNVVPAKPKKRLNTHQAMMVRVCVSGAMIALSVIFCRYLGFPQTGIWRVEIGFLPIAFIAFLWGPVWAGVSYGASDLIGAAVFTGVNPFITLEKILTGVVMGVLFYGGRKTRRRIGAVRITAAFALIAFFGDFLMMTFIFHFAFGFPWSTAFMFRGVNAAVNFFGRSLLMWLADIRLTSRLLREGEKYGL